MYPRIRKFAQALLVPLAVLPAMAFALDTTVTLTADSTITATSTETVTFGLPLAEGEVVNTDEIRVLISGIEQSIDVQAGLMWHWGDGSIRSVTIQLQNVDMTGGDITLTITDAGRNTANDLVAPAAHSTGWATGPASKANMPFPRIFALHDLTYLSTTDLIPPYVPGSASEGVGKLQFDQFDNGYGDLDFANGSGAQANFLFDRATAMMKAYMTTGEVKFLKEGFMTKQLYYTHVKNDGTAPTPPGGDGCWTFGSVACADGKYIYTEPAKIAWGLFGDNSQWDNALIIEMATQADLGWNQPTTSDAFDEEDEFFTERAAGIVGLAEINAYEITGDAGVLATMNARIGSLQSMQQVEQTWDTTNGWTPKSGAFTHAWSLHEGVPYPGDGSTDDRRFSPWMSENIVDFLWHVYNVFEIDDTDLTLTTADIGEMLRQIGNAIDLYGFTSDYQAGLGLNATYATKPGLATISMSCSAPDNVPVSLLYSGSAFASNAAIATTSASDGGFADQHNVETILSLGIAFYFETDANIRDRLFSRIQHIEEQWLRNSASDPENCAEIFFAGAIRLFNWQHRSNSVNTWNWVVDEVSGIYDIKPDTFTFTPQTNLDPDIEVNSNAVTISGLGTGASANVTIDTGTLVINSVDCASDCTVQNGDTLAVKLTSAGTSDGVVAPTVTIGTLNVVFSATTRTIVFDFPGWIWVAPAGCSDGDSWHFQCTGLWVDGPDYNLHPIIATCTTTDGLTCANFGVNRRWTSVADLTLTTNVKSCAGEPADLNLRSSCAASDLRYVPSGTPEITTPDAFAFVAQTGLGTSSDATSNAVVIAGLGGGVDAETSTSNGTIVINTVDCLSNCVVSNGDSLAVRITTSHLTGTAASATVTVGTFSTDFEATTSGPVPDTTPDSFSFSDLTEQELSTEVTSDEITIAGLGTGIDPDVTTDNGVIIINSVDCAGICRVLNGDTLAVRITTSASESTTVTAAVTVGTFTANFNATTVTPTISLPSTGGGIEFTPELLETLLDNSNNPNKADLVVTPGEVIINEGVVTNLNNSGTLDGGTVKGEIKNTASGILNSVKLANGTTVDGGTLTGDLTGSGVLKNALVDVTSIDPNIQLGSGSKVTTETVSKVPGLVLTEALKDDMGMLALDLPLLVDDGKELSVLDIAKNTIDELFGNEQTGLEDGNDEGAIQISNPDLSGVVIPVMPISVITTDEMDSVSIANSHGELVIVSNGIKTTFTPTAADLAAFQAGLSAGGADSNILENGLVTIEFNGSTFSLRFSPVANTPAAGLSGPVTVSAISTGEASFSESGNLSDPASYRIVVEYPDGGTQDVLPAIHDIDAFDAWLEAGGFAAVINGLDGAILFQDISVSSNIVDVWRGIPSYNLLPPVAAASDTVDFSNTDDLNDDGIGDIYFDSSSYRQVIYGLPLN